MWLLRLLVHSVCVGLVAGVSCLTWRETATEYQDAIISKNFGFQFVNNYFVLFYICFIRPFMSDCAHILDVDLSDGSLANDTLTSVAYNEDGQPVDASGCKVSDLSELQFQLVVVFTGKTLAWRVGELAKPKVGALRSALCASLPRRQAGSRQQSIRVDVQTCQRES